MDSVEQTVRLKETGLKGVFEYGTSYGDDVFSSSLTMPFFDFFFDNKEKSIELVNGMQLA